MSLTQPNLHKYFKVKKNTPHPSSKDVNHKTERAAGLKIFEKKLDNKPSDDFLNPKSQTVDCEAEEIIDKYNEPDNLTDTNEEVEEENEEDVKENKEVPQFETPVKLEVKEEPSRKRKREQEHNYESESSPPKTPKRSEDDLSVFEDRKKFQATTPVAKKRLILSTEDDIQEETEKPLDPKTIKEKLGKCGRLDELRAKLLKLNQCEKKLQAFRSQTYVIGSPKKQIIKSSSLVSGSPKKQNLKSRSPLSYKTSKVSPFISPLKDKKTNSPHRYKSFSTLDIEVPLSPSKSPAKAATPKKYSYERFKHLVDPSGDQLPLPYRYQVIKEVFRAVDTVVSILHNRQEIITYSKLKPAVQEMLRKTFSESHLGQLKAVFPLAYFFNREKIRDISYNSKSYQLTVKPNFDYKEEKKSCSRNLMSELNHSENVPTLKFRKMDSVVLVERREIIHKSLLDIVKKRHSEFLSSLNPPIVIDGSIRRWHPEFPIEELSPPPPADLPQPPKSEAPETAKGVLDKATNLYSMNNRMKEAVQSVSKSSAPSTSSSKPLLSTITENKDLAASLKGISSSLLEKIRAREAAKAAREMTRSSTSSRELETLSRLPELVRILRSLFVMEKKAALPWETVMTKLVSSHSGSLSLSEAEKHVNLLMKEVPGWCTSHKVRSGLYLKIDKNSQISDVVGKLRDVIKAKQ